MTPRDAWAIRHQLTGATLNGELEFVSAPFRRLTDHLNGLPVEARQARLDGFLCSLSAEAAGAMIEALAAIDIAAPPPEPERRRSAHLGDLLTSQAAGRFVWPSWIVRGHINLLSSHPKVGKTHFMLDLARRIWFAEPWPDGQPPTLPAGTATLWVCGDRHQDELRERAEAFGLPPEAVRLNALPGEPYGGWDLDDERNVELMRELVEAERPGLVVIDTVWRATRRKLRCEEQVNLLFSPIIDIAQTTDTAFVGLMHLSKDGETLGRRLEGMARSVIKLFKPDPDGQPDRRKLVVIGNFKEPPPLGVTMGDTGCAYDFSPPSEPASSKGGRPDTDRDKARKFIREALATEDGQIGNTLCEACSAATGVSESTFWRAVRDMAKTGELTTRGGKGTGQQTSLHLTAEQGGESDDDLDYSQF